MRLRNLDFLKGVLIITVIVGHVLQGTLQDNFLRYLIYSFHMPMFIGISGYLFNYGQISKLSFRQLISKYLFRIFVPWLVAMIAYILFLEHNELTYADGIKTVVKSFLLPYYHLWFIPAFLSWVVLSWLCSKLKFTERSLLLIAAVISIAAFVLNTYQSLYEHTRAAFLFNMVLYTFRPFLYVFFVLGFFLRKKEHIDFSVFKPYMLCAYAIATVLLFFNPNKTITIPFFFLLNSSLLRLLIHNAQNDKLSHSRIVEWIGVNSLGIYLWHVLPILAIKSLIGTQDINRFYAITSAVEVIFIFLVYQLSKLKLVNKYLFGIS